MDKGKIPRGKIVTSNHSTRVEGLDKFLAGLMAWPEISSIRLGPISGRGRASRRSSTKSSSADSASRQKGAKTNGGFSFKATRLAQVGQLVTGIQCRAVNGTWTQLVVLTGPDLDTLKSRLLDEGYGGNW